MSVFSDRLANCRKEKNISQKAAAAELGVSPALLSHYEKGIRECGPSFIAKASSYYDVTADYLLGLTDSPNRMNAIFSEEEQPPDGEYSTQTVYRALVNFHAKASKFSPELAARILDIYEFALYKLICFSEPSDIEIKGDSHFFVSIAEKMELNAFRSAFMRVGFSDENAKSIKTVIRHCEERIRTNIEALKFNR